LITATGPVSGGGNVTDATDLTLINLTPGSYDVEGLA
jgi:hypothetical protein